MLIYCYFNAMKLVFQLLCMDCYEAWKWKNIFVNEVLVYTFMMMDACNESMDKYDWCGNGMVMI